MEGRPAAADPFGLVRTIITRKYRVDAVVAEGGFGVVYRGHHLGLDVPIAIKVLRPQLDQGAAVWSKHVTQFLGEARAIAKLRHPAVVEVLDVGVMEIGDDLRSVPWMILEW